MADGAKTCATNTVEEEVPKNELHVQLAQAYKAPLEG